MIKKIIFNLFPVLCFFAFAPEIHADFDERFWEMYAEIYIPSEGQLPALGGIPIEPWRFQYQKTGALFSDIRILTNERAEVPYQIVTRDPETRIEEVNVRMLNLSQTKQNETYFVGLIEKTPVIYNMIEILADDRNFYRQVQVFGSMEGRNWNLIRGDSVIFDYSREEELRHVRITFTDSNYKYIAVKIVNSNEKPLKIKGLRVFHQSVDRGSELNISSSISKKEENAKDKESIYEVNMSYAFPIRKILLHTQDKNFQRRTDIFIKEGGKEWRKWGDGIIFSFETEKIKESKLDLTFPETSFREIRLVIKNYDSPPLNISHISVSGYEKRLVFKLDGRQRYYIFWGNPLARAPQYDISQLISKHDIKDIRLFSIDAQKKNPKFSGHEKRLPFTERYKFLLYGVVVLVMAGLIILQYKVIKKTEKG